MARLTYAYIVCGCGASSVVSTNTTTNAKHTRNDDVKSVSLRTISHFVDRMKFVSVCVCVCCEQTLKTISIRWQRAPNTPQQQTKIQKPKKSLSTPDSTTMSPGRCAVHLANSKNILQPISPLYLARIRRAFVVLSHIMAGILFSLQCA